MQSYRHHRYLYGRLRILCTGYRIVTCRRSNERLVAYEQGKQTAELEAIHQLLDNQGDRYIEMHKVIYGTNEGDGVLTQVSMMSEGLERLEKTIRSCTRKLVAFATAAIASTIGGGFAIAAQLLT